MAQLVEWSLPTPEVRGSNPVIDKLYITYSLQTDKNIEKRTGKGPIEKKIREPWSSQVKRSHLGNDVATDNLPIQQKAR